MNTACSQSEDDDLLDLHQCMRSEEELRQYRWHVPLRGEYRFFRSENVVCIEHFRQPRKPGEKAGRFDWVRAT